MTTSGRLSVSVGRETLRVLGEIVRARRARLVASGTPEPIAREAVSAHRVARELLAAAAGDALRKELSMSSYDGGGFEEWVRDSLFSDVTDEQVREVIEVLEPHRGSIEDAIENDFREAEHSWRDFRNSLWARVTPEQYARVDEIVGRRTP